MSGRAAVLLALFAVPGAGCGGFSPACDGGSGAACDADAGPPDATADVPTPDAGPADAGVPDAAPTDAPLDADPALVDECIECHTAEGDAWRTTPSSHAILFACTTCHRDVSPDAGPGHATTPDCADCHSAMSHHAGCADCHDPHGTPNLFMIRAEVSLPDGGAATIHVTAPEGASSDGLVHPDAPGTGICEACHTTTLHYRADGTGAPHHTDYCGPCHDHELGFAPPP